MKRNINRYIAIMLMVIAVACDRELESEGIAKGVIRYPSIEIQGENPVVVPAGSGFTDPGAKALLGTDDITSQLVTESGVNMNTPGVYTIDYTVAITNELNQSSEVTRSRIVSVTSGDVSGINLAGTYKRDGNPANLTVTVSKIKNGVFEVDNLRSTATNQVISTIYPISATQLAIPIQNSPFGRYQGVGTITATGFSITITFLDPPNTGGVNTRVYVKQ